MAARHDVEVARLQLQHDSSRDTRLFPRSRPYFLSKTSNQLLSLGKRKVAFESVFRGDRLRRPVGHYRIVVNAVRQFKETTAVPAELAFKRFQAKSTEVPDCHDAHFLQSGFRYFSHAGNAAHGERHEERAHLVRLNHKESVRLAPVRSDLREEFVRSDSGGRGEVEFLSDLSANHLRHAS